MADSDGLNRVTRQIGMVLSMAAASMMMAAEARRCFSLASGIHDAIGVQPPHIVAVGMLFCVGFGACVGGIVFASLRFAFPFK